MLRKRHSIRGAATSVLSAVLLMTLAGTSFAANQPPFQVQTVLYQGTAFGVQASLNGIAQVGPTAEVSLQLPCGTDNNNDLANGTAAGVNAFPLVTGGATNTSAQSFPNQTSQATADVASVSLLAGLITAQEIKSVSTTTLDASGFHLSSAGSSFNNLVVAGLPIMGTPAPNTQIPLVGLGYVVLNEQTPFTNNTEGQLLVNMVHIYINTANALGIPVGTEIVIASANSGLVRAFAPAVITGTSFGTEINVSGILNSSPTAPVNLPCYGTAGQTITNSIANLNLPNILSSGTITNTGESALASPYSKGEMTSQVDSLNLLSSLVSANVIYGRVDATIAGFGGVFETAVGTFTGISVAGHPEINDNVAYNTSVDIAGLGTLYLKRIVRNSPYPNTTEIRMVELVVNQTNTYELPIGTDVIIGDAQIGIVGNSEP